MRPLTVSALQSGWLFRFPEGRDGGDPGQCVRSPGSIPNWGCFVGGCLLPLFCCTMLAQFTGFLPIPGSIPTVRVVLLTLLVVFSFHRFGTDFPLMRAIPGAIPTGGWVLAAWFRPLCLPVGFGVFWVAGWVAPFWFCFWGVCRALLLPLCVHMPSPRRLSQVLAHRVGSSWPLILLLETCVSFAWGALQ